MKHRSGSRMCLVERLTRTDDDRLGYEFMIAIFAQFVLGVSSAPYRMSPPRTLHLSMRRIRRVRLPAISGPAQPFSAPSDSFRLQTTQ